MADALFEVPSQSGNIYTVDLRKPACDRKDYQYRDEVEECKHIRRVRLEFSQIDVEELELERTASELLRSAAQLESKAEDIYDQVPKLEDARDRLLEMAGMSREEPDVASETRGLSGEKPDERPSIAGGSEAVATAEQTVYQGRRDPAAPVGEEYTVTVNGDECLPKRSDLLSASPSGFSWNFSGSGPAQLALALLAHSFDDEFACEYYQQFKRDVVARLPENGWTLTKADLDEWRREVVGDA